jgi:Transposase domain (DUF772)
MGKHIRGLARTQTALLPPSVEDFVAADSVPRVIDAYVNGLNLKALGFTGCEPADTGRPGYAADDLFKLFLYGYINRIRSSRRLETECKRNLEQPGQVRRMVCNSFRYGASHSRRAQPRRRMAMTATKWCCAWAAWVKFASMETPTASAKTPPSFYPKASCINCLISARRLWRS